jgi:hypothetical protein
MNGNFFDDGWKGKGEWKADGAEGKGRGNSFTNWGGWLATVDFADVRML